MPQQLSTGLLGKRVIGEMTPTKRGIARKLIDERAFHASLMHRLSIGVKSPHELDVTNQEMDHQSRVGEYSGQRSKV